MSDRAHLQPILTRAAMFEAARQRAAKTGDGTAETAALMELARLREACRTVGRRSQGWPPLAN